VRVCPPRRPQRWQRSFISRSASRVELPVVRHNGKSGTRSLDVLRWGLVPFWANDIKVGFTNINAEGIDTRPVFREAFQRRRCLVPIDNFYEWRKTTTGKQPYAIVFRLQHHGLGRAMGKLALADRRMGAQLCDRHNGAERAVRRNP
jgi:hypothetical protein